jgi:hypothetical protein
MDDESFQKNATRVYDIADILKEGAEFTQRFINGDPEALDAPKISGAIQKIVGSETYACFRKFYKIMIDKGDTNGT